MKISDFTLTVLRHPELKLLKNNIAMVSALSVFKLLSRKPLFYENKVMVSVSRRI